ncbi:hypothetical protein HanRHA438_Chr09g0376951 [Helianthus annuus]|nr:hypothetical protein HanRHA438_Chr09g0376951 [Helianthus annuus]
MVVLRDVKFVEEVFPFGSSEHIDKESNKRLFDFPPWYYKETDKANQEALGKTTHVSWPKQLDPDNTNQVEGTNETNDDGPIVSDEAQIPQSNQTVDDQVEDNDQSNEDQMEDETSHIGAQPIRQQRVRTQPKRLGDFIVDLPPSIDHTLPASNQETSTNTVHRIAHFISYEKFTNDHKAFLTAISSNDEPKYFNQAAHNKDWRVAMEKEIKALEENGT